MLRVKTTIILASFVMVINCFAFAHAQPKPHEKLTIALARNTITPAEENYTYAVPKQLGYFADSNLDVSVLPTDGSTAALQAVLSGSADIAYASSVNVAAAIDKGAPFKAFSGMTIKWPYYIAVPKGSSIKDPADLKGKRIGVISLASASYNDLIANLKRANVNTNEVTIIPVGAGARAAAALKDHQIDAIDSYSDSFTIMTQNGIELDYLKRPDSIEKLFSVTMVTSQKILDTRTDSLAAFARAAYKGMIYTKLYPESALGHSFKEFPQLLGSQAPDGQDAKDTAQAMMIALNDSIPENENDPAKWGQWLNIPHERWQAVLDFAFSSGLTSQKLTVDQIWDDKLASKIYDFDPATIQKQ